MDHNQLDRHCRVCAVKIKGAHKPCSEVRDTLLEGLGLDITRDQQGIHPPNVCHNCCTKAKQYSLSKGTRSSLVVQQWTAHTEHDCSICHLFSSQQRGGRPRKGQKNRGRPSLENTQTIRTAPDSWRGFEPLTPSRFLPPPVLQLEDFLCTVCSCIVDRPLETPCRKLVCAECITPKMVCQSCSDVHQQSAFAPVPDVVLKVLGSLLVKCDKPSCTEVVELRALKTHLESGCMNIGLHSPSQITAAQIISRPLSAPPTSIEQKAATNILKRLMNSSAATDQIVKLPTAGQVKSKKRYSHDLIIITIAIETTKN